MTRNSAPRVLIVEDEYFLADDLRVALGRSGITVIGPVGTEARARALLQDESIDCAILDINLQGETVYALAQTLREQDVPFLFVTGYDGVEPSKGFDDVELLCKPVKADAVLQGIDRLIRHNASAGQV